MATDESGERVLINGTLLQVIQSCCCMRSVLATREVNEFIHVFMLCSIEKLIEPKKPTVGKQISLGRYLIRSFGVTM